MYTCYAPDLKEHSFKNLRLAGQSCYLPVPSELSIRLFGLIRKSEDTERNRKVCSKLFQKKFHRKNCRVFTGNGTSLYFLSPAERSNMLKTRCGMKKHRQWLGILFSVLLLFSFVFPPALTYAEEVMEDEVSAVLEETGENLEEAGETPEETEEVQEKVDPYAEDPAPVSILQNLDFSSCRIIVGTPDPSIFTDTSVILSSYNDSYLLQFEDEETAKKAYLYYYKRAELVDIDSGIQVAGESGDEAEGAEAVQTGTVMTAEDNPFSGLNSQLDQEQQEEETSEGYDIALIDTGVSPELGVDGISLIGEDPEDNNGHGTEMARKIFEQNPDAKILSIKVLDEEGKGDVSAVYAALEYAIAHNIPVINLSLSARASQNNSILEEAVRKDITESEDENRRKIVVVGAAGNNGKNAKYYVPGKIEEAIIAGACDSAGIHRFNSNWGPTVDYDIVSGTTSEAAALLSGWISLHGAEAIEGALGQGLIYAPFYDVAREADPEEEPKEEAGEFDAAYTISKTGVQSVKGYQYYIDPKKLSIADAVFTTNGDFAVKNDHQIYVIPWFSSTVTTFPKAVVYNKDLPAGKNQISGGFSLRYKNAAEDAAGNKFDVKIDVSNIVIETLNPVKAPFALLYSQNSGEGYLCATSEAAVSQGPLERENESRVTYSPSTGNAFDVSFKILKAGTDTPVDGSFIWGINDIDIADNFQWIKDNQADLWISSYLSDEYNAKYFPQNGASVTDGYYESVKFLNGVKSSVYINPTTYIRYDSTKTRFWGSQSDEDTWKSGLTILGDTKGFSFRWTGSVCASNIVMDMQRHKIKATITGSYPDGGTITDLGETFYFPGATNTYMITPKTGYYISSLKVDGKTVPVAPSYEFRNITADHTIDVSFAPFGTKTVTIEAKKTLQAEGRALKAEEFSFGLYSDSSCTDLLASAKNDGSGSVTWTRTVNLPGTYDYWIKESVPSSPEAGMEYDTKIYRVQIKVTDAGNGELSAAVSYPSGTPSFVNKYTPPFKYYDLSVGKTVSGNMGDRSTGFHFSMTMQNSSMTLTSLEEPIRYQKGSEKGTVVISGSTCSFKPDGAASASSQFTLSHGESIRLSHVPENTVYKITESEANKNGYSTSISGGGEGTLKQDTSVTFTNKRNAPVPTGIRMITGGGIAALLGLAAVSCWILVRRTRRQREDQR